MVQFERSVDSDMKRLAGKCGKALGLLRDKGTSQREEQVRNECDTVV